MVTENPDRVAQVIQGWSEMTDLDMDIKDRSIVTRYPILKKLLFYYLQLVRRLQQKFYSN